MREIIGSSLSIHTDIADIGPIVSCLAEAGVEAVGYPGEMDPSSHHDSYLNWSSGHVQVIVATKAFVSASINQILHNHVIRNCVCESMLSWVQDLGRAGRDSCQTTATFLDQQSDISHAWNNHKEIDIPILVISISCRYVQSYLAGLCRRYVLMNVFREDDTECSASSNCCDVCVDKQNRAEEYTDYQEELKF